MKVSGIPALCVLGLVASSQAQGADATLSAFTYLNGTFTLIHVPGAINVPGVPASGDVAVGGINNLGQIVGGFYDATGRPHGFLDTNGVFTTINFPGAYSTFVEGINDSGEMAGYYTTPELGGYLGTAFAYINGTFTTLRGGFATGINNVHQVVGSFGAVGYLYANGAYTQFAFPGADTTVPLGINNGGLIVGQYAGAHGFLRTATTFTTVDVPGTTGTAAYGINDTGQVVGYSSSGGFLDNNGFFTNINFPGPGGTALWGINNSGEIVGDYTVLPEPQPLLMSVSGAIAAGVLRRRHRPGGQVLLLHCRPV